MGHVARDEPSRRRTAIEIRAAAVEAVGRWGLGAGASRLVSGTTQLHVELERRLAEFPEIVFVGHGPLFWQGISTDLTGDPTVLLAGETLRYTITVKNIGNEDATNVVLRDAIPANTTYVAGSTTLNGAAVADVGGQSRLVNGMLINSPADPTPGSMTTLAWVASPRA